MAGKSNFFMCSECGGPDPEVICSCQDRQFLLCSEHLGQHMKKFESVKNHSSTFLSQADKQAIQDTGKIPAANETPSDLKSRLLTTLEESKTQLRQNTEFCKSKIHELNTQIMQHCIEICTQADTNLDAGLAKIQELEKRIETTSD